MFQLLRYKSDSRPPNHQQQRSNELSLGRAKVATQATATVTVSIPLQATPSLTNPIRIRKVLS